MDNLVLLIAIITSSSVLLMAIAAPGFVQTFKRYKKNSNFKKLGISSQKRVVQQIYLAVDKLSQDRIGALITISNKVNLDNYRTDGIVLDANISALLLISIFQKESPLHDGALIIKNSKIIYASTYFKITSKSINLNLGARHRAALGISEQTDALAIIVSEQTGEVSIARQGVLTKVALANFQVKLNDMLLNN